MKKRKCFTIWDLFDVVGLDGVSTFLGLDFSDTVFGEDFTADDFKVAAF